MTSRRAWATFYLNFLDPDVVSFLALTLDRTQAGDEGWAAGGAGRVAVEAPPLVHGRRGLDGDLVLEICGERYQ